MTLRVLDAGLMGTIQDGGRPDAVRLGVPRSGACDPLAMAAANLLLGNPVDAPVVELSGGLVELHIEEDCVVAVSGADLGLRTILDGQWLRPGTATLVLAGRRLVSPFGGDGHGAHTYLALAGGVDAPRVLGSASSMPVREPDALTRPHLRSGDVLRPTLPGRLTGAGLAWPGPGPASGVDVTTADHVVRVLDGPHRDTPGAGALLGRPWVVEPESDRAGLRLRSVDRPRTRVRERRGQGRLEPFPLVWGAIEMPAPGTPIVLLADAPTVGGYPVPFVVIRADLPVIGQLRPWDRLRFRHVDAAEAHAARAAADADLQTAAERLRTQHAIW